MKRWHYICETGDGVTTVKTHVEGIAGIRCEAESAIAYAKHRGEPIRLTNHSRLEYREPA